MPLTPEEEKRIREEIRKELETREARLRERQKKDQEKRRESLESRIRQQIKEEEEERYFTERGYVKYVNHRGEVEWLSPEEADHRYSRRRTKKKSSHRGKQRRRKMIKYGVNLGILAVALGTFYFLYKYRPAQKPKTGNMVITTDIPGAQVFLNGAIKQNFFTPDTFVNMKPGVYFVSVYKDGYSFWPPMQKVIVEPNKLSTAFFEFKNTGKLGKVEISANVAGFRLFVDGLAMPASTTGVLEIPAGYHVISAVKNGYTVTPQHRRILIKEAGITRLNFTFQPADNLGYLEISSNRSDAYVYLNNRLSGIKANSGRIPIPAGVYEIRVCENGYRSIPPVKLLEIDPGRVIPLTFNLIPETEIDTIAVLTPEPGASILLDGKLLPYVTPLRQLVISSGTHYINLMRDGKLMAEADQEIDVSAVKNQQVRLSF